LQLGEKLIDHFLDSEATIKSAILSDRSASHPSFAHLARATEGKFALNRFRNDGNEQR
jgi:hypothetical protein